MSYESQTVVSLRDILRERGLKVSGKKADLIVRLIENDKEDKEALILYPTEQIREKKQQMVKKSRKIEKDPFLETDDIIAFYGHKKGKYACFSNWCRIIFVDSEEDGVERTFYSTEQYLMWRKAKLFGDTEIQALILSAVEDGLYSDALWNKKMGEVKKLGRQVRNFDEEVWKENREEIMYDGLLLKFTQNVELRALLVSTGDKIFVEAAPRDRVWGAGVGLVAATDSSRWRGLNLLGNSLMRVRDELIERE